MNKLLALLVMLVIAYQSLSPLLRVFTSKKPKRKAYTLTFSKKFNHLFSATLLLLIPLVLINNYYSFYFQLPFSLQIAFAGIAFVCWLCAAIAFYLYSNYKKKIPYTSFVYDPNQDTFEFLSPTFKSIVRISQIEGVEWYSIHKSLKLLPWSNFEYAVLTMRNGNKILLTSLLIDFPHLQAILRGLETMPRRRLIPSI